MATCDALRAERRLRGWSLLWAAYKLGTTEHKLATAEAGAGHISPARLLAKLRATA